MSSKDGSYLFLVPVMGLFFWFNYNKPRLSYQWVNGNQLVFNLTKGSKGVNGTINVMSQSMWDVINTAQTFAAPINNNISWQGNTAFSVIPQADSVFFQVQEGDKIIFTQTVNKEA